MRHTRKVLVWAGMLLAGVLGCKHPPELKPPEQPEVLAAPGENDKRYQLPPDYPPEVLASDPSKKQDGLTPAGGKRGGGMGAGGGMGGPGGGGMGSSGMGSQPPGY